MWDFHVPVYNNYLAGGVVSHNSKTFTGLLDTYLACKGLHPVKNFQRPLTAWTGGDTNTKSHDALIHNLRKIIPKDDWSPINGPRGEWYGNRFPDGTIWHSKSYAAGRESFQGPRVEKVQLDEKPPKPVYQESLMRGMECRGTVMLTMTAVDGVDWVYRDLYLPSQDPEKAKEMGVSWHILSTEDAPWIPKEELRRAKSLFSPEEYKIRILGHFVHRQGLVYGGERGFNEAVHMAYGIDALEKDVEIYELIDPGHHHFAVDFVWVDSEGRLTHFDEMHEQGGPTISAIQEGIRRKREKWGYVKPKMTIADTSSWTHQPGQTYSVEEQFSRGRFPLSLTKAKKEQGDAGIFRLREYLTFEKDEMGRPGKPWYRVSERCTRTIYEFQNYMWRDTDPSRDDDRTQKKNDHHMDNLKYLAMELPEPARLFKPVELEREMTMGDYKRISAEKRAYRERVRVLDWDRAEERPRQARMRRDMPF